MLLWRQFQVAPYVLGPRPGCAIWMQCAIPIAKDIFVIHFFRENVPSELLGDNVCWVGV